VKRTLLRRDGLEAPPGPGAHRRRRGLLATTLDLAYHRRAH